MTIRLGDVELPAHQLVFTTQSDYFSRALSSAFKEGKTRIFEYNEGSMHAYWRCFKFMYTGEYDEEPAPELAAVPGMLIALPDGGCATDAPGYRR